MPQKDKFAFVPSFSLQPNKVVAYNSVFIRDYKNGLLKSVHDFKTKRVVKNVPITEKNVIKRTHHNFRISDNAYRNLKKKINWLYYLAKSKSVKTYNGKSIFNFKIAFITLTLPSKQRTSTKEVTNLLLNTFLTEVRQRTDMKNYVWRLEFQKNGNVHYHLVTDTYLDYFFIQKIWNRILKQNGYIDDYKAKFQNLSLSEYRKMVDKKQENPFNVIAKRYAKGKASKWENPNSVDVKSVISKAAISSYIAKYFGKTADNEVLRNEYDTDENSESLRLWFCSRSLSKLNTISNFREAVDYDIFAIVSYCEKVRKVVSKYAISYYFEISKMTGTARKWIEMLLKDYSKKQGYIPAS